MRKTPVAVLGLFALLSIPACMNDGPEGGRPDSGCGTPEFTEPEPVECDGGLVITELMPKPGSGADYEWFEVMNGSAATVSLDGVLITRSDNDEHRVVESGVELAPGEFAVIARSSAVDIGFDYATEGDIQLPDSGENTLLCLTCDGEQAMDCVEYAGDSFPSVSGGISLQVDLDGADPDSNDSGDWWCHSDVEMSNGDFGTPGDDNTECPEPVVCPDDSELIITEVMAGPTELEFIEVQNLSATDLPWSCLWVYDGGSSRDAECAGVVPSGGYGVIARDLATLSGFVEIEHACQVSVSVSDGGDSLSVGVYDEFDASQQLDTFTCDDTTDCDWDKYSALGLDPSVADVTVADDAFYWCHQISEIGDYAGEMNFGTPGLPNDDCDLPVDADNDGSPAGVDCDDDDPDRYPGNTEINDDGIDSDCDGEDNILAGMADVLPGELLVTEFMPNPDAVGDSAGEYVEIVNLKGEAVNLLGLELSKDGSSTKTVDASIVLEDGGYFVFARTDDSTNGGLGADWDECPSLTNGGDVITLSFDGEVINEVSYSGAFGYDEGVSAELIGNGLDNTLAESWCSASIESPTGDLGSPGTAGSCPPE
jgi:hypothetical protein